MELSQSMQCCVSPKKPMRMPPRSSVMLQPYSDVDAMVATDPLRAVQVPPGKRG